MKPTLDRDVLSVTGDDANVIHIDHVCYQLCGGPLYPLLKKPLLQSSSIFLLLGLSVICIQSILHNHFRGMPRNTGLEKSTKMTVCVLLWITSARR